MNRRWDLAALGVVAVTTLLRLLQLSRFELAPDEAYYWDWSRRPALGYYDQGPMIAYVIRATTALFGTNEFGVRFGVLTASLSALLCCWWLARKIFSPRAGFITVCALAATPLMELGSLIATYDPLLVCFWAATVVCLERAVFGGGPHPSPPAPLPSPKSGRGERGAREEVLHSHQDVSPVRLVACSPVPLFARSSVWWLLAGLTTGLGFLSKHTMLLIAPCLLVFLAVSRPHRFWLRWVEPYAALGVALLLYTGVFWWNAHHHWWTFGHLLFLAAKSSQPIPRRLGEFLGSQAGLLGPGLFIACLTAGWQAIRQHLEPNGRMGERGNGGTGENTERANRRTGEQANRRPEHRNTGTPERLNTQHPTPNTRCLFLACMGLPVFLFFCAMAFKAKVQGNWAPCAWLSLTVLWAGYIDLAMLRGRRGADARHPAGDQTDRTDRSDATNPSPAREPAVRNEGFARSPVQAVCWTLAAVVASSALVTLLLISPSLRRAVGLKLPPEADLTNTAYGWRNLAAHVQRIESEMQRPGHGLLITGNGYQYCALMAFYLPGHPETYDLFLHNRLDMYAAYVDGLRHHLGDNAIFLNDGMADDHDLRQIFAEVTWDPPYNIWRRPLFNRPVKRVYIARCRGMRKYVGLAWARGG